MSQRTSQGPSGEEEETEPVFGDVDPRRRALLLESEAEELRQRLDALLAEIARHRRPRPEELIRRFAIPVSLALVLAGAGWLAMARRRHRRRVALWARLMLA
jgi:hypothetical protein